MSSSKPASKWKMAFCHSSLFAFSTCFQWMLALILCALLLRQVGAQKRSDEVRALLDFKNSDIMSVKDDLFEGYWSTWNESAENPCSWTGVVCSTNFTVVELDLSGWGMGPTSLQPLAGLRDLRHLDLSSSFLFSIPDDIGMLTGLVRLDLSQNDITGRISDNVFNYTSLQYLSLEQNQLSGEIPSLSAMVNLEILNLADNLLTGEFPKDIPELRSLVSIDLSRNMLNGSIPSLLKLTNLEDLRLDDNSLTKFEQSWLAPPGLRNLLVSGNQLEGMIPSSIANLSTLQTLNMSRNQLSSVPFSFSQLLTQLYGSLALLDLSQNQLTGNILESLLPESTEAYASVNLSHNNLTGNIPLDGDKPQVYKVLDLSYNQLSGPVPSFFKNTTSIDTLRLQNNNLSGDIVDIFLDPILDAKTILLANELDAPSDLTLLVTPVELRLQNNMFTGDLSRMICATANISLLQILDISNNDLQMTTTETNPYPLGAALECFMQIPGLQEFQMAGNDFSGTTLPTQFTIQGGPSSILAILDLSNNHIEGEVSDSAFNSIEFPALQLLNLSSNDLVGLVPESIVNLPNLTILDVANNSLSGPLPFIPSNSRLYNPSFFAGNGGLCGDPLPPCKQASRVSVPWWQLLTIVGGSMIVALGSCLVATWRWRVYHKRHQQDEDLIKTLMDRESATVMALRDLKKATHNFAKTAQIGEGGFGAVYIGKLNDGRRVAIKRSKREGSEKDKEQFLNEVSILSQISHRHLVKLLGCCMENRIALLVFEFISNGNLQEHLQGKFRDVYLSWDKRLNIAIQTAEALNYLHSGATFPIYHRDVKSANILLNEHFQVKVADFGISRLAPIEATHVSTIVVQGTIGYIDPEYYTSYQLNDKSDVYSFGVVLLELISAKPAIDFLRGGDETSLVNFSKSYIQSGDLQQLIDATLLETYNDPNGFGKASILNVGHLAMKCLDMQSKARPSMKEVMKELQNLKIELNGQFKDMGSTDEHVGEHYNEGFPRDLQNGHIFTSFMRSLATNSSSFILQNSGSGIEMSQFSSISE